MVAPWPADRTGRQRVKHTDRQYHEKLHRGSGNPSSCDNAHLQLRRHDTEFIMLNARNLIGTNTMKKARLTRSASSVANGSERVKGTLWGTRGRGPSETRLSPLLARSQFVLGALNFFWGYTSRRLGTRDGGRRPTRVLRVAWKATRRR